MENTEAQQAMEARFGKLAEDEKLVYTLNTLEEAFKDHSLTEEELQFVYDNTYQYSGTLTTDYGELIMSHPNTPYEIMEAFIRETLTPGESSGWNEVLPLIKKRGSDSKGYEDIMFLIETIAQEHLMEGYYDHPEIGAECLAASGLLSTDSQEVMEFNIAAYYDPSIV